jgi:hypothetical protein
LGEQEKALDCYRQALPLYRAAASYFGEARALCNIGLIHSAIGEKRMALEAYGQALTLWRAEGNRGGEADMLENIGNLYTELGEQQKALDYYRQALPLYRAVGDRGGEASTLNSIGEAYQSLGENQKALEYYSQALTLNQAIGNRSGQASALAGIARVERERGNLLEARTQMEAALSIVESLRTKVASQELRASYLASKQNYYEFYTELLMRLHQRQPSEGHDAVALQASERARARSLLETLTEARADIRQGVDPLLLERERALQQQLNAKEQYRMKVLSDQHTKEQAAMVEKELKGLLAQYQEVQAQIRRNSPRYAALTQPQPLSLKEIQQQVLDEDTLLLEYALGEERSFLWAVAPTSITSFELPKRKEIEDAAKRVYTMFLTEEDAIHPEAVAELSQTLLGPVADQLGTKRLLIVADGALQYLPFGALPVPKRQLSVVSGQWSKNKRNNGQRTTDNGPLIVDHEIVSLPSVSVLAVLRKELAGRQPASQTVAVLADPVFQSDDLRVKTQDPRPKTQDPRPFNQSATRNPQSAIHNPQSAIRRVCGVALRARIRCAAV